MRLCLCNHDTCNGLPCLLDHMLHRRDTMRLDYDLTTGVRKFSPVTRAGVFVYHNDDGTTRREFRPPEWVFHPESMASLAQVPVTLGHPSEFVTDENTPQLMVGMTGDSVRQDGDLVLTPIKLVRRDAKLAVQGGIRELSCGYDLRALDAVSGEYNGEAYDAIQVGPYTYNHVALVAQGRAGPNVRYMDGGLSAGELAAAIAAGEKMETQTIRIDDAEATIPTDLAALLLKLHAKMEAMEGELAEAKAQKAAAVELETLDKKDDAEEVDCSDKKDGDDDDMMAMDKKEAPRADAADTLTREDALAIARARVLLETSLTPHLPAHYRFDGKTDAEIRADALHQVAPNVDVTGKSDDYIAARLDAVLDGKRMDGYRGLSATIEGAASTVDKAHEGYLASVKARQSRERGVAA